MVKRESLSLKWLELRPHKDRKEKWYLKKGVDEEDGTNNRRHGTQSRRSEGKENVSRLAAEIGARGREGRRNLAVDVGGVGVHEFLGDDEGELLGLNIETTDKSSINIDKMS